MNASHLDACLKYRVDIVQEKTNNVPQSVAITHLKHEMPRRKRMKERNLCDWHIQSGGEGDKITPIIEFSRPIPNLQNINWSDLISQHTQHMISSWHLFVLRRHIVVVIVIVVFEIQFLSKTGQAIKRKRNSWWWWIKYAHSSWTKLDDF